MRPGETLDDRYLLLERIGEGGVGRVHRGVDRATGQVVAIKVLRELNGRSVERFARESRVLAELGHPHIVRYVAHGVTASGAPYLAMEWLEGESLAVRLERGALGVEESLDLAVRIADALAAAHAHGVVHRDVKPSNLFLVNGAVAGVRVLDFGMVLALHGAESASLPGVVLGTPGYVAPEQVSGDRARVDARADVFSLGAVLFECLTGRRAFPGDHLVAVLAQLLLADPPRVRVLRPEVPAALDDLVARLLAKEPAERPGDGAAVLAALEALGPVGAGVLHARASPLPVAAITGDEQRLLAVIALCAGLTMGALPPNPRAEGSTMGALPPNPRAEGSTMGALPPNPRAEGSTMGAEGSSPALATIHEIATRVGARVDALASGTVLVTLAGAASATVQALRAARTALDLRAALPGAAIAVAMGRGEAGGWLPVSSVGDRAAELLAGCEAGEAVRIDDTAHALLDQRFEARLAPRPRPGWDLLGEREISGGARLLLGRPSRYVGRERELKMLRDLILETFAGDRSAQAAVVTAAAGIGKTRLRHELVKALRAAHPRLVVATGHSDAMSAGSAFVVVASVLRNSMFLGPEAPAAEVCEVVLGRTEHYLPAGDSRRVAAFLGEMMGAPFPDDDLAELRAARRNPARMAAELVRAFVDFVRGVTASRPVLMVLEDLHWGDAASIRLVDQALRDLEGRPFVVLGLARPEVHELFPDLWSKRGAHNIRLGALPRRAAEELVTSALDAPLAPADVARICEQAGGNAFYLEELIRAFAAGQGAELPETVLGIITARLEALPAAPRILLRAASVFGQEVPGAGAIALLAEAERAEARQRWLPWLVQQEILVRRGGSGEDLYAFRHALLREGSYAMLTERDRILGHRLAAAWVASAAHDGRDEVHEAVVGEHLFRGELWAEAFACFDRAGDAASRLRAAGEARQHYERALEALDRAPDDDETRRRRAHTLLKKTDVSYGGDDPSPNPELDVRSPGVQSGSPPAASEA